MSDCPVSAEQLASIAANSWRYRRTPEPVDVLDEGGNPMAPSPKRLAPGQLNPLDCRDLARPAPPAQVNLGSWDAGPPASKCTEAAVSAPMTQTSRATPAILERITPLDPNLFRDVMTKLSRPQITMPAIRALLLQANLGGSSFPLPVREQIVGEAASLCQNQDWAEQWAEALSQSSQFWVSTKIVQVILLVATVKAIGLAFGLDQRPGEDPVVTNLCLPTIDVEATETVLTEPEPPKPLKFKPKKGDRS